MRQVRQRSLVKRVISYPVDLAFRGFRSLAVSALIVNTERMRGYWQRSAGFIAVFGCVLFPMRAYTSVTIEMWHNHLVTELVIKCCSFVVSLKTDIYLPWSQRVGERRVVWYENRRRGKKEASASPTIACGNHLWYSSLSVRLCVFYLFIWKTNQTALLLKPRVRVCVYTHVCVCACVFISEVCVPHLGTKTRFKAHFLSTDAHQSKSGSSLGFTHHLTSCVKLMVLQTAVASVPWQDVAYIQSDKCWFHFSTSPASMRVKYSVS